MTVAAIGQIALTVPAIAGDNKINIAEKAAGFAISGDTGSVTGVTVTVKVGTQTFSATSDTADPAEWSVDVPADASYITESSVTVTVDARKTGHTDASQVSRSLVVDLTAPSTRSYSAPASLTVGAPIGAINPSTTTDTDIAAYSASGLPPGLAIDASTGAVSGTPTTAKASGQAATVTITDTAGNTATATISFPLVSKGTQTLSGFSYSKSSITYGDDAPIINAPSGAVTTLEYSASPASVCSVGAADGTLTINGIGICTITATAPANTNYNQGSASYEVTVAAIGQIALTVPAIAGDNKINIAEKAAGFAISGDTGSVTGVTVTVKVGTQTFSATSDTADPAEWSVDVPADASYITESSVTVTVDARKTGHTDASQVSRSLVVDLTAPSTRRLLGAGLAHRRGADRRDQPLDHHRYRHRRLQRQRPAAGPGDRRLHRRGQRHPDHRQGQRPGCDRHHHRHRRQHRHRHDQLPAGLQGHPDPERLLLQQELDHLRR